jgi:NDP-sugar pyrophosphorylase family protein
VTEPFKRLIADRNLLAHRYNGFWAPMDTLKDKHVLEALVQSGRAPWQVWNPSRNGSSVHGSTNEMDEYLVRQLDE